MQLHIGVRELNQLHFRLKCMKKTFSTNEDFSVVQTDMACINEYTLPLNSVAECICFFASIAALLTNFAS